VTFVSKLGEILKYCNNNLLSKNCSGVMPTNAALEIIFTNQLPKIKVQGKFGEKDISPNEIVFLKTDRNYLDIHTEDHVYHHRSPLKQFIQKLPNFFVQVNRFTVVNSKFVEQRTASQLKIREQIISISRNYRKALDSKFP